MNGDLYIVATPIGNLEDITLRALNVLKNVDLIAAEDTRHTLKLLNHFEIIKPLISYYRENEKIKSDIIIEKLLKGDNIAVVSDAGTPGISDPGEEIIRKAIEKAMSNEFRNYLNRNCTNPYGDGHSSERILDILMNTKIDEKWLVKMLTY